MDVSLKSSLGEKTRKSKLTEDLTIHHPLSVPLIHSFPRRKLRLGLLSPCWEIRHLQELLGDVVDLLNPERLGQARRKSWRIGGR